MGLSGIWHMNHRLCRWGWLASIVTLTRVCLANLNVSVLVVTSAEVWCQIIGSRWKHCSEAKPLGEGLQTPWPLLRMCISSLVGIIERFWRTETSNCCDSRSSVENGNFWAYRLCTGELLMALKAGLLVDKPGSCTKRSWNVKISCCKPHKLASWNKCGLPRKFPTTLSPSLNASMKSVGLHSQEVQGKHLNHFVTPLGKPSNLDSLSQWENLALCADITTTRKIQWNSSLFLAPLFKSTHVLHRFPYTLSVLQVNTIPVIHKYFIWRYLKSVLKVSQIKTVHTRISCWLQLSRLWNLWKKWCLN